MFPLNERTMCLEDNKDPILWILFSSRVCCLCKYLLLRISLPAYMLHLVVNYCLIFPLKTEKHFNVKVISTLSVP